MTTRKDAPRRSERWWEKWHISKDEYDRYVEAKRRRDKRVPRIGDVAPEFEVERLDRRGRRTGGMFRMSSMRGKPVAIVFGSYT
jgi:hypothetical protein